MPFSFSTEYRTSKQMGKFLDVKRQKERQKVNAVKNAFKPKINTRKSFKKKKKIDKRKYHKYLRSEKWKTFRELALDFHGRSCGKCGSKFNLQVHHKNYRNIFNESFSDVIILCDVCHRREHKNMIFKNGKESKYMRNPSYDKRATTWIVPKRQGEEVVCSNEKL